MLTFFILLLTFSTPKVEKLYELRGSIRGTFGIFADKPDDRDSFTPPREILQGRDQKNPFAPAPPKFRPLQDNEPNVDLRVLKDLAGVEIHDEKIAEGYKIRVSDAIFL